MVLLSLLPWSMLLCVKGNIYNYYLLHTLRCHSDYIAYYLNVFFVSGIFGDLTWRPGATGGTPYRVALLCFACSLFRLSDR